MRWALVVSRRSGARSSVMPDLTQKTDAELRMQLRLNNHYIQQVYDAGGCSCFKNLEPTRMPGIATCLMAVERIEKELERRQLNDMYKGYVEP